MLFVPQMWLKERRKMSELSGYQIKHYTQDAQKRKEYWETGIGLNKVDNLTPSEYLLDIARKHIEGEVPNDELEPMLHAYYDKCSPDMSDSFECDIVTKRIVDLLDQKSFTFSPQTLKSIHKYLFTDVLEKKVVGKFRDYNITKAEPLLDGDTVNYGNWMMIQDLYEYDFETEKAYHYSYPITEKELEHFADFISRIWQVHPFGEGNTRTTAVFTELYLNDMGYDVDNEMFKENAVYFRGALVRANYRNVKRHIDIDNSYLNRFFENLLMKKNNVLSMHDLQIAKGEAEYGK